MAGPPTGTLTFLFTDIERSTKLWENDPEAMRASLARHDEIVAGAIDANGGYVFKTIGDAFCAAFATAPDALEAALEAQRKLPSLHETKGIPRDPDFLSEADARIPAVRSGM